MPVVDKNQLKLWFKNLAKPVQEQFWNWMDSFYHKSEPIPKSAVENLTTDLAKKADLVGGVVPASQLPFTVNASEVISVGEISATENTVNLAVHSSGTNAVRINGVVLTRSFPNTFNFTPVTTGSKFLILYAVNDSGIFRLAEGVEDLEAVEPELPTGALFVRRILINSAGADIELPSLTGFKEKIEDNWKVYTFSEAFAPKVLPYNADKSCSFLVQGTEGLTGDLHLGGIKVNENSLNDLWSGKEFTIKNNTSNNLILLAYSNYTGSGVKFNLSENLTLSAGKSIKVKVSLDASILEVLQFSSPVDLSTKQDRLQGISVNIGVGKKDASATEKLDVNGRTKSDGIVINETTSAILPKEIKFKDGKFKGAKADGIEKAFLMEGDTSSNLLVDYKHSSNVILQPTAIDYSTGYVTVPNHGLTGDRQIILVPNDYSVNNFAPSSMKYIPYEYIVSNVIRKVIVIDANTLKLVYNWQNITPTVNPSSTENLNNLDISKWHIEVFTQDEILFNIPNNNIKKISIDATGWGYTEVSSWGVFLGLWVNGVSTSNNFIMNIYPINTNLYFLFFHKIELSVFNGINPQFLSGGFIRRTSGASAYPYTANNIGAYDWNTKFNTYTNNNGISVVSLFKGLMGGIGAGGFRPANGTNVKIYNI